MSKRIKVDQLADEIMGMLEDYRDQAADVVKDAVMETAKDAVYGLQDAMDQAGIGGEGDYENSISYKKNVEKGAYGHIVYARPPHYRLTHLLEKGHDLKRNGEKIGHVKAFPHWAVAEEKVVQKLSERILSGLSRLRGGGK